MIDILEKGKKEVRGMGSGEWNVGTVRDAPRRWDARLTSESERL